MVFTVEQECPQCGGAIALDEADRLFRCPYCSVSSFLANTEPFCFVLPTKGQGEKPLYVPFIRFRGAVYTCHGLEVSHRILDVTHLGFPHPLLPVSLGFRPQVMKMKFVTQKTPGDFLPCRLSLEEALTRIAGNPVRDRQAHIFHQAQIGESCSFIYLPTAKRGAALYDLVTDTALGPLPEHDEMMAPSARPEWHPIFLTTLCPGCGSNLSGGKDSIVLFCPNCETAWEPGKAGFQPLPYKTIFAELAATSSILLPFWAVTAEGEGLQSFADFLRLTNQPKVIAPAWEQKALCFISPALKLRPKVYLRLAGQMTMAQTAMASAAPAMAKAPHPVNLPKSEAIESLKIILASTAVAKKNVMPLLPDIHCRIQDTTLLLLPFQENNDGFYQEQLDINISRQDLELGQSL